jgi:hypothetical protein
MNECDLCGWIQGRRTVWGFLCAPCNEDMRELFGKGKRKRWPKRREVNTPDGTEPDCSLQRSKGKAQGGTAAVRAA